MITIEVAQLDHEHGTVAGISAHRRNRTKLCKPCADRNAHYQQAYKIFTRKTNGLIVPVGVLAQLLNGADPDKTLVEVFGQEVVDAIEYRGIKDRSVR